MLRFYDHIHRPKLYSCIFRIAIISKMASNAILFTMLQIYNV
uniref:Uncharacterized protein n=1 Tax=Rhizophora mucronata TaxID=61149 RepID=A0A2P2N1F5_RHIMU